MRALLIVGLLALLPYPLLAHGIGQRIDLPIPLEVYLGAAAVVLVLSFVGIGVLGKRQKSYDSYPSYNVLNNKAFGFLVHPITLSLIRAFGVIIFGILLYAGFFGAGQSTHNILPIFVWVVFTVGLTYFIALIGNIWTLLNPWRTIHALLVKDPSQGMYTLPSWVDVWPAFLLFFGFRYLENIFPDATDPQVLVTIISFYALLMIIGMTLFGRSTWLAQGDAFSVFFKFLSQFSIFEYVEEGGQKKLTLRLPGVGLLKPGTPSISEAAFIVLILSTVSFDGLSSTALAVSFLQWLRDVGISLLSAKLLLLVSVFLLFGIIYMTFAYLMRSYADSSVSIFLIGRQFVLSLLPIAIAYEISHFLILLITEGQRVFGLLSDPFGYGWNLFGTVNTSINYAFLNFKFIWNFEVLLILTAHIISIYLAHMIALRVFVNYGTAMRSQIPMLILMIGYTVFGLWLLAQPPVLTG